MSKNPSREAVARNVGVIIPTFRRPAELLRCIQSLRADNSVSFDIVVINDGADEQVSKLIADPELGCIELKSCSDLWWTKSVNIGLRYLKQHNYKLALILNDDVVATSGYISNILDSHTKNRTSIIISKIVNQSGGVWSLGGYTSWPWHGARQIQEQRTSQKTAALPVTWSPGMGTLVPLVAIEKIGLLDHKAFPQYFSDVDFGLRATSEGWKILLNPDAVLINDDTSTGGVTSSARMELKDLKFIFFDYRSPDNIRTLTKFIYRHAPRGLRTVSLIIRLMKILIFFLRRFFQW